MSARVTVDATTPQCTVRDAKPPISVEKLIELTVERHGRTIRRSFGSPMRHHNSPATHAPRLPRDLIAE
jgi:hypothetical protein